MIFDLILSIFSISPWVFILSILFPKDKKSLFLCICLSLFLGYLSTVLVIYINDIFFNFSSLKPKTVNILTYTAYISFIQAGMIEEVCKGLFAFILGFLFYFDKKEKLFRVEIFWISGFISLGFAGVENFNYIQESSNKIALFIARTFHSSNIHLLIGLLFSLIILKKSFLERTFKFMFLLEAFLIAILVHGLVDFFLIPGSKMGRFLSTLLFVFVWAWVVLNYRNYIVNRIKN